MKSISLFCTYTLCLLFLISCKSDFEKEIKSITPYTTVEELSSMLKNNEIRSTEIVNYYLDRIYQLDTVDGGLNSIIQINPDAMQIAKQLDEERSQGKIRGPLHGIPLVVKDNIDTHDKMPNTAGSLLLKDNFPTEDAFIVSQFREYGLIVLGKANLSEWANFRSTNSSSGWSSFGGQTVNPYDKSKSPCGSSSGSGVAVSAGLVPLAVGTETDGSIACPSAVNGVVGIKPTVGLWSRGGIIPISHTQDTPGPIALTVKDAASLLSIGCGKDPKDKMTVDNNEDYTKYCQRGSLKGKRIGVDSVFYNIEGQLGIIFNQAMSELSNAGAELIGIDYRSIANFGTEEYTVLLYEFKNGLNDYLKDKNLQLNNLTEVIAENQKKSDQIMPFFDQEIFIMAEEKGNLNEKPYLDALGISSKASKKVIDSIRQQFQLDAFVGPTMGQSWDIDHKNGDKFNGPSSYSIFSRAGYPHITVPMGMVDGLPVGISFLGTSFSEPMLISLAYDYEQMTKHRINPQVK